MLVVNCTYEFTNGMTILHLTYWTYTQMGVHFLKIQCNFKRSCVWHVTFQKILLIEKIPPVPNLWHQWELSGNYPIFTMVMVIYNYFEIIWRILVTPNFLYNIHNHEKYYPCKSVHIHKQSWINITQDNNRVITTKKG